MMIFFFTMYILTSGRMYIKSNNHSYYYVKYEYDCKGHFQPIQLPIHSVHECCFDDELAPVFIDSSKLVVGSSSDDCFICKGRKSINCTKLIFAVIFIAHFC